MSAQEKVAALLGPVVAAHSLVLDDVEVSAAGKRRLVRVTVDHRPHLGEDGWIASPTPA